MYIRFYENENDDYEHSKFIHSINLKDDYSEYIKTMKAVDSILIDGFYYDLDFITFKPAENDDYVNCIDVYVKIP
jgi:hypothetical protein